MIMNLKDKALKESGLALDSRFKSWVKYVTRVDPNGKGTYMFPGPFVGDGTVELPKRPALLLCAATSGSRANNATYYCFLIVNPSGDLVKADIPNEDDRTKGWHLRVKDRVLHTLQELDNIQNDEPQPENVVNGDPIESTETPMPVFSELRLFTDEELVKELVHRGYYCHTVYFREQKVTVHHNKTMGVFTLTVDGEDWGSFTDESLIPCIAHKASISKDMQEFFVRTFRLGVSQE